MARSTITVIHGTFLPPKLLPYIQKVRAQEKQKKSTSTSQRGKKQERLEVFFLSRNGEFYRSHTVEGRLVVIRDVKKATPFLSRSRAQRTLASMEAVGIGGFSIISRS